MFNQKNFAAIYLERNHLVYVYPEKQIVEQLVFDTSLINHLEIKDSEKFVQYVKAFFEKVPKDSALIFLSKPIIFEREIEVTSSDRSQTLSMVENFLSMVPINKNKLGSKVLEGDGALLCLAANREYYELVIKGAEFSGIKITAVSPAFLFTGLEDANGMVTEKIEDALLDSDLITNTNFLDKSTGISIEEKVSAPIIQDKETIVETSRSRTKTLVLTLVLIGLLSFSIIFSYVNGLFDRFFVSTPPVTDLPIATQSAEIAQPSPSPVAFTNLRASVKNGTGISGQAAKAKELLDQLNLEEVIIATDSGRGAISTLLEYDPIVPEQLVLEVKATLETVFDSVEEKEATNTGEFDFIVTTGRE